MSCQQLRKTHNQLICCFDQLLAYICDNNWQQEVIIKRREGQYPTLTIPCTNALRKVHATTHQVLSFCINTFRVTKDLMIGVNSFVGLCIQLDINIVLFIWGRLTSKKCSIELDGHSLTSLDIYTFKLSLKSHCQGFLDCSLCCSTPFFCAESWKFILEILELIQRYLHWHS